MTLTRVALLVTHIHLVVVRQCLEALF